MREEIQFLTDALATKGIAQAMAYYRFEGGEVRATDGRITAGHPTTVQGTFLVPGKDLGKLLARLPGEPTLVELEDGKVQLWAGKARGTITTLPVEQWDYPVTDAHNWEPIPDGLLELLDVLRPFVSDNANQIWSMGIALDNGWAYATNNVALAGAPCPALGKAKATLPVWAADFVASRKVGITHWAWDDISVSFKWDSGAWMRSVLIDVPFHERAAELIRKSVDEHPTQVITDEFRAAIDRACGLASTGGVAIYADRIEAAFDNTTLVEGTECEVPEGHDHSVWTARYLAPVFQRATHWQPARWPAPSPFKGDIVSGYVAARNH